SEQSVARKIVRSDVRFSLNPVGLPPILNGERPTSEAVNTEFGFSMADWNDPRATRQGFGAAPSLTGDVAGRTPSEAGLRRHMPSVYNSTTSGVLLTGHAAL